MHVYARSLNSPPAQSELTKDTGLAMEWLERAATAGWPESLLSLGNAHQYGMYGKVVDYEQAFYFYEKAGKDDRGEKNNVLSVCSVRIVIYFPASCLIPISLIIS
jgi:hypothetical protein